MKSNFEKMDKQDDIHTTYSKLYKVFEKHEKLYRLATRKLYKQALQVSEMELEREELSTKVDEFNQTIETLRF